MSILEHLIWSTRRKIAVIYFSLIILAGLGGTIILSVLRLVTPEINPTIAVLGLGLIIGLGLTLTKQLRKIIVAWGMQLVDQMHHTVADLEKQIEERAQKNKVVLDLSQQLSAILDLNTLMRKVVTVIKETFDYYHVHIYLLDEHRETLVMAEGYGQVGAAMKKKGHSIPLTSPRSLVAQAAREGQVVTVANVREDPAWLPNPLLPETRCEMAIPVMLGGEVVGVLDVQSEKEASLTAEDEGVQHALANQVAIAVHNTRLFAQIQEEREYLDHTVDNYLAFIEQVAGGDLTVRLSLNGDDNTLTTLGDNLNKMVERLGEMTNQIREATTHISAAATEIMSATSKQATGASEQSAAISQTSTTIDEVKTVVEQAFAKAQTVAKQAQHTRSVSQGGKQAVTETVDSMSQIKEKVEGIAENILALSEQTQQIGEITATVNELASQSNLLALNASIEAARAGEHGKGFAVVAVEVRNLAEQSRQATAQVKAILSEIQRATNAAVMATEEGAKGVDSGVQLTRQAGETIQQLAANIAESASAAQQIVASAQQQTTGVEQIGLAIANINQATIQNLASTRQTEKSAQDLSSVARQLEALIAQYKLA